MHRVQARGGIFLVVLLVAAAASAEPEGSSVWTFELVPRESEVRFELGATLHTVRGTFDVTRGRARFDPETGAVSGRVVVDAGSGDSGNGTRDANMREWVLESETHPEIVFEPTRLDVAERSEERLRGRLEGRLTIHGGPHTIAVPLDARRIEGSRWRVHGAFDVPFVEWGMTDPSNFLLSVDKVIAVEFTAEGDLTRP